MPYALLEKEIEKLDEAQQNTVVLFVRFLLSQKNAGNGNSYFAEIHENSLTRPKIVDRKLGGYEKGFFLPSSGSELQFLQQQQGRTAYEPSFKRPF